MANALNNVVGSGQVAAQRLQQVMEADDTRSKQRNKNLLECVIGMEKVFKSNQSTVSELTDQVEALNEELQSLREQREDLVARNEEMEEKNLRLAADNGELHGKISDLEAKHQEEVGALQKTIAHLIEVTDQASQMLEQAHSERDELLERLGELVRNADTSSASAEDEAVVEEELVSA